MDNLIKDRAGLARCTRCKLRKIACFCREVLPLDTSIQVSILAHSRELKRPTSSSHFFSLHDVQVESYQRTDSMLHLKESFVLFPCDGAEEVTPAHSLESVLLLDGTWQEARKMWNQCHERLKWRPIVVKPSLSNYPFRKNQVEEGVSTIEAYITLEEALGHSELAAQHRAYYQHYLRYALASHNGHALNA